MRQLTKREAEILKLIAKGKTNLEIAGDLSISQQTVKNHVSKIFLKLEAKNRIQALLKFAFKEGKGAKKPLE